MVSVGPFVMVTITRIALVVVVILGGALAVTQCRLSDLQARLALETLPDGPGWVAAAPAPPTIPGVPRRRVVATVEGSVRYLPIKVLVPSIEQRPCDLNEVTADLNCRVEVVEGGGRLQTWGRLVGFGQTRDLPRSWAGEVSPGPGDQGTREAAAEPTPVTVSAPPKVHVNAVERPLLWEARLGVVLPDYRVRLGATRMLWRHVGVYGDATVPTRGTDDFDVGAGVAIRF